MDPKQKQKAWVKAETSKRGTEKEEDTESKL